MSLASLVGQYVSSRCPVPVHVRTNIRNNFGATNTQTYRETYRGPVNDDCADSQYNMDSSIVLVRGSQDTD